MHNFLFGIYPYIALAVLAIGSIARYERDPFTWKSKSSQLLRRKQLILGSVLFHIGVLTIFFGHLVGLLSPIVIWDMLGISHTAKQLLAVIVGGVAGVAALVGGILLLHRRLMDPRIRATSNFADIAILVLLLTQLVLGLGTIFVSLQHLDGGEMVRLMTWAQAIFTFQPNAADNIIGIHWLFQLHLVLGLTIFLVFPFTRLVHMLSAPLRYVIRPGFQIVRTRKRGMR
ncbi:respiratory nitrate reductase subunit gamma [Abyssibius alkaniclasticus]|uniref:respiratory nitrate reductase subunit gamma n=1 Tax=Abyssibius alkaniclasticus TaxID=2881234 RepID=UPI0023641440|nr:respiratory nitrate reductase subunit gamma [Abyssibius alkaniclasticus]UPH70323.1 respiratory nitrate reductase subunit gamma [Abyssibius alkaniclasticus]|tara:strand:- start:61 stop:747 length:687 start_codon:yes stop_codon:yes gene_type:complete